MKSKVLITGGAGYVGTSLIPQLLMQGYTVRVFDNLMYGGSALIPFFEYPNFEFMKGDIRNIEEVKRAVEGQDIIVHLAAIVGYPACRKDPILAEQVNVQGTKNLLAAAPDKKIIFSSTGSNYGAVEEICTEETPLNPLSLYGQTKTLAENLISERGNSVIYRFATGFGVSPRFRLDLMINDFAYKAFTEGYLVVYEKSFKRTFIHVQDMARAFIFAIENFEKMRNNIFNVGSESLNYSKEEICKILERKVPLKVHYAEVGKDEDQRNYFVSYKKINDIGFKTAITLEEGIDRLLEAFKILNIKNTHSNV